MQAIDDLVAQHNVKALRDNPPKSVREDYLLGDQQLRRFERAYEAHEDYMRESKRLNDFYLGEQWEAKDLKKLEESGRPALTINRILPTINTLMGEQISTRVNLQFKPKATATHESGIALTHLVQSIMDANLYQWVESDVYEDGLIMDRGFLDVRMDFDKNLLGEIAIGKEHPHEAIPDPDSRSYDPKDWSEYFTFRWLSLDEVETLYGKEAADRAKLHAPDIGGRGVAHVKYDASLTDTLGGDTDDTFKYGLSTIGEEDRFFRTILVFERQYYRARKVIQLIDLQTGDTRDLPHDITDEQAGVIARRLGLEKRTIRKRRVYWCTTFGKLVFEQSWSPYESFTCIPFFPYFRNGRAMGVVKNLVSAQEQYNKLNSQELHTINQTANSGWVVEEGALAGGMTPVDLEDRGAESGLVVIAAPGKAEGIQKIKPNPIPTPFRIFFQ